MEANVKTPDSSTTKIKSEEVDFNETSSEVESLFDVSESEEKRKPDELVKGYCLYKHMANGPLPTDVGKQKTVVTMIKEKSSSNKDFSLSLMKTDLQPEQETKLQDFLIKRLSRSTMYSTSGSLATLSISSISEKPVTCYYKLIKGPNPVQGMDDKTMMGKNGCCTLDFLVCFVVSETSNLHLFQQELERYCKGYETLMSNSIQTELDASDVFKDLDNWYDVNILYVGRCTKLFQLELSSLISMGLLDQELSILGCDEECKEDIRRFVDICSLSNLLSAPIVKESNHKLLDDLMKMPKNVNTLTFSESDFKFEFASKEDICKVCDDWANIMVDGEQTDPVFLRQVMENYKLKVIQDMNSLKRLLREAEKDHYALFRSYVFLSKCHSSRIVMAHIRQEAKMSMTKDICDVIDVLDGFIVEKGGFSKIRIHNEK